VSGDFEARICKSFANGGVEAQGNFQMPLAQSFEGGGAIGIDRSSSTHARSGLVGEIDGFSGGRVEETISQLRILHGTKDDVEQTFSRKGVVAVGGDADLHAVNLRGDFGGGGERKRAESEFAELSSVAEGATCHTLRRHRWSRPHRRL